MHCSPERVLLAKTKGRQEKGKRKAIIETWKTILRGAASDDVFSTLVVWNTSTPAAVIQGGEALHRRIVELGRVYRWYYLILVLFSKHTMSSVLFGYSTTGYQVLKNKGWRCKQANTCTCQCNSSSRNEIHRLHSPSHLDTCLHRACKVFPDCTSYRVLFSTSGALLVVTVLSVPSIRVTA